MKKFNTTFICLFLWLGTSGILVAQEQGAAVHDYIGLYQKYLRGLKDVRCPMYPTCSHYGMMAFADHSFPVAMVLTADRMTRCGGHLEQYPVIKVGRHSGRRLDFPPGRPVPPHLMAPAPHDVAAETIVPTDSVTKFIQFTNALINQHSYASAMLEIDRLLYTDSVYRLAPTLYTNKMRCFEGLQQYSDGLLYYEQQMPEEIKANYKVKYTAAHLYDLVGDYATSSELFREASSLWDSNEVHPYGELTILYARESLFDEARRALERKCTIDGNLSAYAASCTLVDQLATAKQKSPTAAMLLGILPGAGYLYTGQPRNAITSLVVNSVLAYAVYTSFKTENYGLGIILGAFSVSFYGGNIVGSGRSARHYNEYLKRNTLDELRKTNPFFY